MNNNSLPDIQDYSSTTADVNSHEHLEQFINKLFQNDDWEYAAFSFPIQAIDPLAYLEMCWNEDNYHYYWEKPSEEFAIAAGGKVTTIADDSSQRFNRINTTITELKKRTAEFSETPHPNSGLTLLGGFSFFEETSNDIWKSFKPASFTLPTWLITKDGKFTMVTFAVCLDNFSTATALHEYLLDQLKKLTDTVYQKLSSGQTTNRISTSQVSLPNKHSEYNKWLTSVNKAKQLIHGNKFEKIVLARSITLSRNKDITVTQVINNLRKRYINCYNFLIHQPTGDTFLGSTPERLAMARNNLLLTEALAGSIKRGQTATEDSMLEKKLSDNRKDRSEHQFVIKDIEERLSPSVKSLVHDDKPQVKKLSNVQHLYTPMRAQLKDHSSTLEVIGKLHPTPAVGGYPWQDAAPHIKELEHFERGWYAGPVGWINATNNMEFAVAIRSGLFTNDKINLFAGCGIVNDSDPATEWEETNLKFKPLLSVLQYD